MAPERETIAETKPWFHLSKILTRAGPLAHPGFEAGLQVVKFRLCCICHQYSYIT